MKERGSLTTVTSKTRERKRNRATDQSTPSSENALGPWLSAEQAAEYLALTSTRALYPAVRRGELPAYRFGRRLRFRRNELDAVLSRGRVLTLWTDALGSEA
jgi:excisionase family DNA binding protein